MAIRNPNAALRRLREARGTREEVAEALAVHMRDVLGINRAPSPNLLGNWERGEVRPSREYRQALRSFYQATDAELGLTAADAPPASSPPGPLAVATINDPALLRQFMQLVASVAFNAVPDQRLVASLYGEMTGELPTTVEAHHVDAIDRAAELIDCWDTLVAGGVSRPDALRQLSWAARLLDLPCAPGLRDRLHCAVAHFANVVGFAAYDAGMHADARRAYLLGLHAAKQVGEWGLWTFNLTSLARQFLYFRQPREALALLHLAEQGSSGVAPAVTGLIEATRARSLAVGGQADDCQRAIDRAQEALTAGSPEEVPAWVRYCTPKYLVGVAGGCYHELASINQRLAVKAVEKIEAAVKLRGPATRSLAFDLANLASVHLHAGQFDAAAQAATRTVEMARNLHSARLTRRVKALRSQMAQHHQVAVLGEPIRQITGVVEEQAGNGATGTV